MTAFLNAPLLADSGDLEQGAARGDRSSIEWSHVRFKVKDKMILNDVSGIIPPGEIMCILGPSGAGKTTLLNILAGRMRTSGSGLSFEGDISLMGKVVDPVEVRSRIAYVMQEDALPAFGTPREILRMSALLRSNATSKEAITQADSLLSTLRLEKCADTQVGSVLVKGISGGEKKRTAVAVELITKPSMLFLDEPLSGLDSYAAWTVLKELAVQGCSVACTVHQPSSEIFDLFDRVICLAQGQVVYGGVQKELFDYMRTSGNPVPFAYNPADHLLFVVQTKDQQELEAFMQHWSVEAGKVILPEIQRVRASSTALPLKGNSRSKGIHVQLWHLFRREVRDTIRNRSRLVFRFGVAALQNLLIACIFFGVGGKNSTSGGLRSHFGALTQIMISTMVTTANPLLLAFAFERPIFLREYSSHMYSSVAYFLSKTLVEIPVTFMTVTEMWIIAYFLMDFQGNFLFLVLISVGLCMGISSVALMLGCSVATAKSAQELAPLVLVPQILFTGIFVSINLIPRCLRWIQYGCALKYALNLVVIVEFADLDERK